MMSLENTPVGVGEEQGAGEFNKWSILEAEPSEILEGITDSNEGSTGYRKQFAEYEEEWARIIEEHSDEQQEK